MKRLLVLAVLVPAAAAHVVPDTLSHSFGIASYVAHLESAPLLATHNATLALSVTTGGVMPGHPVESTRITWNASLGGHRLNGSFTPAGYGRWATALAFPASGNWTFTLRMESGVAAATRLWVHPHLGFTVAPEAPLDDPPAGAPFTFRFRFVPEPEHPGALPRDAVVRLEWRGLDERVKAVVASARATSANGSWEARLALPDDRVHHLAIASSSFGFDALPPFSVAASKAPAQEQDHFLAWALVAAGVVGVVLLRRVMNRRGAS